MRPEMLEYVSD